MRIAPAIERFLTIVASILNSQRVSGVPDGLRVLRGVQNGTETDTLPGQAPPQRLESIVLALQVPAPVGPWDTSASP